MPDCCGGAPVEPYPVGVPTDWPCENYTGTTEPIPDVETPLMAWEGFADASTILAGEVTWSPPDDPATVTLTNIRPPRQRAHVGFPEGCFDAPPSCYQKLDLAIPRNWRYHAHMLWLSYEEPESQGEFLQSFLPCGVRGFMEPNGEGITPGTFIGLSDEWNLVYISGTTTFEQKAFQASISEVGPTNFGSFSTLAVWADAVAAIVERIVATGGPFEKKWFFAGHSYGSAVASILAADMHLAFPNREIVLFTEGAPCPGDGRLRTILSDLKQVHLQNVGDGVCSMPPRGHQYDLISWVLTDALRDVWPIWQPHNRRVSVSADGSYRAINEGELEFGSFLTLCTAIAEGIGLPSYDVHGAGVYLDRCLLIND